MSEYQSEKRKVQILLGVGIILCIAFLVYASIHSHLRFGDLLDLEAIFTLIAIACYPIGIVYGGGSMLQMYRNMRAGDRISSFNNVGAVTISVTILWIAVALALTICFGWIIGVVKAYKKLKYLKNY